jgi:ABC-type multidrug transport system ATPase subunit
MALGRRPGLVMLDEPLSDLDPLARKEVMQTLMAEVADTGMTVLLSSHVLADIWRSPSARSRDCCYATPWPPWSSRSWRTPS